MNQHHTVTKFSHLQKPYSRKKKKKPKNLHMTNSSAALVPNTIKPPTSPMETLRSRSTWPRSDTGSTPTWIQAEGCVDCFEVSSRLYNHLTSVTYQAIYEV